MTSRLLRSAELEFKCDWCGDVETMSAPGPMAAELDKRPPFWWEMHGPFREAYAPEQLCPPCGMRAVGALAEARHQRTGKGRR